VQFIGVQFTNVPINSMLAFHYILAFAVDYTPVNQKPTPTPTNGVFNPFWDTSNLSPSAVAAVKATHPNVTVMVGISGDSVGHHQGPVSASSGRRAPWGPGAR
jgi:hypothetical protein